MDRSSTVFAACALVSLWACTRDDGAVAEPIATAAASPSPSPPPASAPPSPRAGTPIVVPDRDDVTLQPRQAPIDDRAAAAAADGPLPENSDVAYRCEDGGRLRVVYTRSHANLSLHGVFLPLQPWLQESRRTGAEAWAGDHVALVRRGEVIELREADGDLRRCRVHAGA